MRLLAATLHPLTKRFVAGESAVSAIAAARRVNDQGIAAILDFLGEDVLSADGAAKAADEYIHLLRLIHDAGVRASVSLKVSQMGIRISPELCLQNIRRIAKEASHHGLFVWFDMEGSELTQKTIDVFDQARQEYKNLGLCLQAYLVRTGGDLDRLMRTPLNVRLCRGAYKESPDIAYATPSAVEGSFRMIVNKVLDGGHRSVYPAFATHDDRLIDYIRAAAEKMKVSKDQFEFQMLYGIQQQALGALAKQGYRTGVYIPYGTHWLPYFIRRIRERKENLYFLMRNVFRV